MTYEISRVKQIPTAHFSNRKGLKNCLCTFVFSGVGSTLQGGAQSERRKTYDHQQINANIESTQEEHK